MMNRVCSVDMITLFACEKKTMLTQVHASWTFRSSWVLLNPLSILSGGSIQIENRSPHRWWGRHSAQLGDLSLQRRQNHQWRRWRMGRPLQQWQMSRRLWRCQTYDWTGTGPWCKQNSVLCIVPVESSFFAWQLDDTAANDLELHCKSGTWASLYGASNVATSVIQKCPEGQVICGLRTNVLSLQGVGYVGDLDDLALTTLMLRCCNGISSECIFGAFILYIMILFSKPFQFATQLFCQALPTRSQLKMPLLQARRGQEG